MKLARVVGTVVSTIDHPAFDERLLDLRRRDRVRLISIDDRSRATPEQLQNSVFAVGETFLSFGQALESQSEVTEAALAFRQAATLVPTEVRWLERAGVVLARAGRYHEALSWLAEAERERSSELCWIGVRPAFSRLRTHPRFVELIRTIGLPAA